MKSFLMILLLTGFMAACSQDEVLPVEVGLEGSYVAPHDCEGCEGEPGPERDPPGNVASKERGITIK